MKPQKYDISPNNRTSPLACFCEMPLHVFFVLSAKDSAKPFETSANSKPKPPFQGSNVVICGSKLPSLSRPMCCLPTPMEGYALLLRCA